MPNQNGRDAYQNGRDAFVLWASDFLSSKIELFRATTFVASTNSKGETTPFIVY